MENKLKDKKDIGIIIDSKTKREIEQGKLLESHLSAVAEEKAKHEDSGIVEEFKSKLLDKFGGEIIDQPKPVRQSEKQWQLEEGRTYKWVSYTPIDFTNNIIDPVTKWETEQKLLHFDQLLNDYLMVLEYPQYLLDSKGNLRGGFKCPNTFNSLEEVFGTFKKYIMACIKTLQWRIKEEIPNKVLLGQLTQREADDVILIAEICIGWEEEFLARYDYYRDQLNQRAYEALKSKVLS